MQFHSGASVPSFPFAAALLRKTISQFFRQSLQKKKKQEAEIYFVASKRPMPTTNHGDLRLAFHVTHTPCRAHEKLITAVAQRVVKSQSSFK